MADAPQADLASLAAGLQKPIGTPTLKELARESKKAAIAVEDITRPSPLGQILALVTAELEAGGLNPRIYISSSAWERTPLCAARN